MQPSRLLVFSPSAFQPTGHQLSYLSGLGEALARQGVEMHVFGKAGRTSYPASITPHKAGNETPLRSRSDYRERLGPLGDVAWGAARFQYQAKLMKELRRVHHALGGPPLLFETFEYLSLAAHLARTHRPQRQVCIFHDTNFNLKHASIIAGTYKVLARPFARHILRRVDRAFVHAAGMRENLLENIDPKRRYSGKLEVLPYGAPHPDATQRLDQASARAELGITTRKKLALAFGTLRADKCFHLLFQGLAQSPEWELIVAGPEGDVSFRELRALCEQARVGERVRMFTGFIGLEEHRKFFGAADAVINIYDESIRHESGTAQLARSFLRPIIVGGPPDLHAYVKETGVGWCVAPLSAARLSEVLGRLARIGRPEQAAMERRIYAVAVERSWDTVAARVLTALKG